MTAAGTPRLAPLPREALGADARAALAQAFSAEAAERLLSPAEGAPPLPNVLATLLHHPALAGPFLAYNDVLLRRPTLEPRLRELVVLRVAHRTRAPYEWAQHVRLARGAGVTDAEVAAIAGGDGEPGEIAWTPLEAAALAATDQLLTRYRVDDDTWARLARDLDERGLVELLFVVGTYTGLAMAFNSWGLQLDPDLRAGGIPAVPDSQE